MISSSNSSTKYQKAQEWGVSCVSVQWLLDTAKEGKILPSESYGFDNPINQMIGEDVSIRDITNDDFVQGSSTGRSPQKVVALTESAYQETGKSSVWQSNGLLGDPADLTKLSHTLLGDPSTSSLSRKPTEIVPICVAGYEPNLSPSKLGVAHPSTALESMETNSLQDDDGAIVPSSNSPSPLKAPRKSSSANVTLSSPTRQTTYALKSAITSLLGKRTTSDELDTQGQAGRSSKRSKPPPRSKVRVYCY